MALSPEDADRLAEEHLYLVAREMRFTRSKWRGIASDDIQSAAFDGLASALATWNPDKSTFAGWAAAKIKWAILEHARSEYRERSRERKFALELVRPRKVTAKIEPRRLSDGKPNQMSPCQDRCCGHPWYQHHASMGCLHWDCRLPGSGYCQCDGYCASVPVSQQIRNAV